MLTPPMVPRVSKIAMLFVMVNRVEELSLSVREGGGWGGWFSTYSSGVVWLRDSFANNKWR